MLRALAKISGFTLLSRVAGLVRDRMTAELFGTSIYSDAFFAAFKFPNMFRSIFGEGAFNSAFVPQYAGALAEAGQEKADLFASRAFSWLVCTLSLGALIAIPLMRWIMAVFVFGFLTPEGWSFSWDWLWQTIKYPTGTEKFELTVTWARIMFSYLLCMALAAQFSGILNSWKRYSVPAFMPVLLNLVLMVPLFFLAKSHYDLMKAGEILSWSVILAGICQVLLVYVGCRKAGIQIRFVRPVRSRRINKLFLLMGPGVLAAGIQQVNLFVGTLIASSQENAVSFLYYAERIFQLPLGMIGIAFGVVLLPEITRKLRLNEKASAVATLQQGINFSMLMTIPAAVAMLVIPAPIMGTLFGSGEKFNLTATSAALMGFSMGLPAYVLIKVLQPAFFARENTKTPMKLALCTVSANILFSLCLFPWLGHVGIAVATTLSAWVNVSLLFWNLRDFLTLSAQTKRKLMGVILASLVMGLVLWLARPYLDRFIALKLVNFIALIGIGAGVYAVGALGFGATTLEEFKASFKK